MDKITRKMGDGWHTYLVYTEAEALEKGLNPIPWRDAEPGDWALSDDGHVGECLRTWQSNLNASRLITLTYGADWSKSKQPLLFKERFGVKYWSYGDRIKHQQRDVRKTRARNAISAYVIMLLSGQKVDWKKLSLIYRQDFPPIEGTLRRDFKKPAFKNMIQKELEKALLERGSSPGRTIEMYNEAFTLAAKKERPSVMIEVADRFSEFWRLKETLATNGELPEGIGSATILEGVSTDLQIAKEASNGERD